MKLRFSELTLAVVLFMGTIPAVAAAQEAPKLISEDKDWSAFSEAGTKQCWSLSNPKKIVNMRDGKTVDAQRGDILLFVTFKAGSDLGGEVAFTGGYPFAEGSRVKVQIGDQAFEMIVDGEWAWPLNVEQDAAIIAAMAKGSDAVFNAASGRGTKTTDTFSLAGFSSATEKAQTACK